MSDAVFTLRLNPAAAAQTKAAIFQAVQETFEIEIKADAKRGSPVLTGYNRDTIDTEVKETPRGVVATLFSQSGYGGYLEVGTRFMKGFHYMGAALDKNISFLYGQIRKFIGGVR